MTSQRVQVVHETAKRLRSSGIFHRTTEFVRGGGRLVSIDGRDLVNFGSCSYLGLETDPRVIEGAYRAMREYGTQFSTSRAYVSIAPYARLEALLSTLVGGLPVVLGTTTTLLHAAALPVLVEAGDLVLFDAQVHNSVQSVIPMLLALGARAESVPHNRLDLVEQHVARAESRVFYLCDAIYSMHGDCVPVEPLLDLLNRYPNLWTYIDDAHGLGWAGKNGAGAVLGAHPLHSRMFVALGMAKAFACSGAFLVCPTRELADRVFSCGSTMIFSGPIVPAALGAAVAVAEILLSDEFPALQRSLLERVSAFIERCEMRGLDVLKDATPLKYLRVGEASRAEAICRRLLDEGYFTNVAVYPAVPRDGAGIRVLFNLHQTLEDVTGLADHLAAALETCPARKCAERAPAF